MTDTLLPKNDDEQLRDKLASILGMHKAKDKWLYPEYIDEDGDWCYTEKTHYIDQLEQLIKARDTKMLEQLHALYRADIAQAIGYCQGLGHPDEYLEKRYPELAQTINPERTEDFSLQHCPICNQMTNHKYGMCMKHTQLMDKEP